MIISRAAKGFTLIEVITVTAIFTVLLAVAAPSFTEIFGRIRLKGAAGDFYTDMQYARSEAVQKNTHVRVGFSTSANGGWCYVIYTGNAGDCLCGTTDAVCAASGTPLKNVSQYWYKNITAEITPSMSLVFEPRQAILDESSVPGNITFTNPSLFNVRNEVNSLGRIRTCAPSGNIPGYPVC